MKTDRIIIVEGKYDAAAVRRVIQATIVETGGFSIFNDVSLQSFIKKYASKRGIVLLTDSDRAGFRIRKRLEDLIGKENIINAYIPRIEGKEKRKSTRSKEGLLGVEGIGDENIRLSLEKAGIGNDDSPIRERYVTKVDLYEDGISGSPNASERKRKLLEKIGLPQTLSSNRMLEAINIFLSYEEYKKAVLEIEEKNKKEED